MLATAASASKSVPSVNEIPGRRSNVHTLRLIRDDRLDALRTYQGSRLTSAIEFASEYVDTFDQLEIPVPNLIEGLWKAEESIATGPDTERTLRHLRAVRAWVELKNEEVIRRGRQ